MLPCPLGSYCPHAKVNITTGLCDPYKYQFIPNSTNVCGSADMWADYESTEAVFCPEGYYCPSTTSKISCSSGHYCRLGSTTEDKCIIKDSCKANTKNESIFVLGAGLVVNPYKIQSFYWFATFHLILSGNNLGVICSLQIPDPLSLVDFSSSPPMNIKLNFPISYRVH